MVLVVLLVALWMDWIAAREAMFAVAKDAYSTRLPDNNVYLAAVRGGCGGGTVVVVEGGHHLADGVDLARVEQLYFCCSFSRRSGGLAPSWASCVAAPEHGLGSADVVPRRLLPGATQ